MPLRQFLTSALALSVAIGLSAPTALSAGTTPVTDDAASLIIDSQTVSLIQSGVMALAAAFPEISALSGPLAALSSAEPGSPEALTAVTGVVAALATAISAGSISLAQLDLETCTQMLSSITALKNALGSNAEALAALERLEAAVRAAGCARGRLTRR